MHFVLVFVIISLLGGEISGTRVLPFSPIERVTRSHGCGEHPLVAISNEIGGDFTPEEILYILEQREDLRDEVLVMLQKYDDCIRTGDGMRYKKGFRSFSLKHGLEKYLK